VIGANTFHDAFRQLVRPWERSLFAIIQTHLVASRRILWRGRELVVSDIDCEDDAGALAGGGYRAFDHQPPGFGLDGGDAGAPAQADEDGSVRHIPHGGLSAVAGDSFPGALLEATSISRRAAISAPSVRTEAATSRARAATPGWTVWLSASVSESAVGAPGACAVPIPRWWTLFAQ